MVWEKRSWPNRGTIPPLAMKNFSQDSWCPTEIRTRHFPHKTLEQRFQSAAIFVNYMYNIKITQQFKRLGIPLDVIFPRAAREPAHNNGCGPLLPPSKKTFGPRWSRALALQQHV
jgi:hypothetical protein